MSKRDLANTPHTSLIYNVHPVLLVLLNILSGLQIVFFISLAKQNFIPGDMPSNPLLLLISLYTGASYAVILGVTIASRTKWMSLWNIGILTVMWAFALGALISNSLTLVCIVPPVFIITAMMVSYHNRATLILIVSWIFSIGIIYITDETPQLWLGGILAGLITAILFIFLVKPHTYRRSRMVYIPDPATKNKADRSNDAPPQFYEVDSHREMPANATLFYNSDDVINDRLQAGLSGLTNILNSTKRWLRTKIEHLHPLAIVAMNIFMGAIVAEGMLSQLINGTKTIAELGFIVLLGAVYGVTLCITLANRVRVSLLKHTGNFALVWASIFVMLVLSYHIECFIFITINLILGMIGFSIMKIPTAAAKITLVIHWLTISIILAGFWNQQEPLFWQAGVIAGLAVGLEFVAFLNPNALARTVFVPVPEDDILDINDPIADDYAHGRLTIGDDGELTEWEKDDEEDHSNTR